MKHWLQNTLSGFKTRKHTNSLILAILLKVLKLNVGVSGCTIVLVRHTKRQFDSLHEQNRCTQKLYTNTHTHTYAYTHTHTHVTASANTLTKKTRSKYKHLLKRAHLQTYVLLYLRDHNQPHKDKQACKTPIFLT